MDSATLLGLAGIGGALLGAARVTSRGQAGVEEQKARRQACLFRGRALGRAWAHPSRPARSAITQASGTASRDWPGRSRSGGDRATATSIAGLPPTGGIVRFLGLA
jgi:hypothetical protein